MEYPVWQLSFLGGGFWIAFIATIHVFVAHFAVGGGLFLVLTEKKALREESQTIMDYVRRHAKFFLLLTLVFGGVSGVGIWFTISLVAPEATSILIHNFVFGWATEWVCFLGEIVAILLYYYSFGKIDSRKHLRLGWLYFIFAWLSLLIINAIIGFMLTPGQWLQTHSFWDGVFNPSFWPSLFFRSFLILMVTGLFCFFTASRVQDEKTRHSLLRYCALWVGLPFLPVLACGYWYLRAMPPEVQDLILVRSREIAPVLKAFLWLGPIVVLGGVFMALKKPNVVNKLFVWVLIIVGFGFYGSFEFIREAGRKPYLIHGYIYSNGIRVSRQAEIQAKGIMKSAKWVSHRDITDQNLLAAGKELFEINCLSCHSVGGPLNDILPRTAKFGFEGMQVMLGGIGKINTYMPPFWGTALERKALAAYIVKGLHHKPLTGEPKLTLKKKPLEIPPFDAGKDEYVLLSWNNLGMHCISDCAGYAVILPPANDLFAQLVKRGSPPEVVTEGVEITYRVQPGFENPSAHSKLWEFAPAIFGKKLPKNVGLSGNGLKGKMKLHEEEGFFEASLIPVVPYPDSGGYDPYPLFTIEARDKATGKVLARTKVVAPTATEMGCKNCHGGPWKVDGRAGISDQTAADVLATHDRMSGTDLLAQAKAGKPRLCQSCHPDPVLNAKGDPKLLNLPAALHGLHANYLGGLGTKACFYCHPSRPHGPTRCLRGVHAAKGLDCTRCHGFLEDHALSLLKKEKERGKKGAARLMKHLKPRTVASLAQIKGRTPWAQEPDCMTCHPDYRRGDVKNSNAFNTWTKNASQLYRNRKDETCSLSCEACHGSPHAVYPARNPYNPKLDNIQPLQYQGNPRSLGRGGNCKVCHTEEVDESLHHAKMSRGGGS